jgi:hypothetical protein
MDPTVPIGPGALEADGTFTPGEPWTDTNGEVIQAHGGQVVVHEDADGTVYYWYGEDRSNGYGSSPGVHVYSSPNLDDWTDEGLALRTLENAAQLEEDEYFQDLYADYDEDQKKAVVRDLVTVPEADSEVPAAVLERPKVLYNETTETWVLWVHADGPSETSDAQYAKARAGVAVADSPFGPFRWIDSYRLHVAPEGEDNFDPDNPGMARDMTVFQDDDGTAYIIYSSEENYSLFISKLDADYTYLATGPDDAVKGEDFIRPYIGAHREAPALFKRGGVYYLITSGATGWDPNPASYATATDILGEWTDHGNPCVGDDAATTFGSQSTNVIPVDPDRGIYVYMGDRWTPSDLGNAPYVWLPIAFGEGTSISLQWQDEWSLAEWPDQPQFEVEANLPDFLRPGRDSRLPRRVTVIRNGKRERAKVTWEGDVDRPGRTTLTGTIRAHRDALTFTRPMIIAPRRLEYVVNAGGQSTSDYQSLRRHSRTEPLNTDADQEHGKDAKTGATWGYSGSSDSAGTGNDSMDLTVRYAKDGDDLRYRLGDLKPGEHTVHICFYEPWPQDPERTAKVTLNGDVIAEEQRILTTPTVISHSVKLRKGEDVDLVISPLTDLDVQVSWVIVERG